ncbi:nitroreductase [uncultured Aeromicrobium sp.]|uniref:nitroreductase n=1 Tax=uncultured Aeromicrobium sp. TaxID=337820 RepID=UPI0025F5502C|nr:nitroreductase [uncultured Aeromicrobium sp.]
MTTDIAIVERLLADRRSCRGFEDAEVPEATIVRILQMAQRTPSWCNTQPWHVELVSGPALDALRKAIEADTRLGSDFEFPTDYEGVYRERRREAGWQLYESVGVQRGDREASAREMLRNFEFFGAPHAAILTVPASLGVYALVDAGLYIQSFLLAVQAHGLGAVAQAAIAQKAALLREWFDWDPDRQMVCAIAFGHPDHGHPANDFRTGRAPIDASVRWHR